MPSSRKIVVFGGTGFVGSPLVQALADQGASVTVVARRNRRTESWPSEVRLVTGDAGDRDLVMGLTEGADAVYLMTAGSATAWEDWKRTFVDSAATVADCCQKNGVRRLIYVSSIAALYLGDPGKTIDETAGVDAQSNERSFYARAKAEAEKLLLERHAKQALPVVIVRPGIVVGPGGMLNHSGLGNWASDMCCLGWGQGDNSLPFVLVQDVVAALVSALETGHAEGMAFNLAGDCQPSAREFFARLQKQSGRPYRYYPQSLVKTQMLEIGKWFVKWVARRDGLSFPSYRDLKSRSLRTALDCSRAKKILGWQPNSDPVRFYREALEIHLQPIPQGDLRLANGAATLATTS